MQRIILIVIAIVMLLLPVDAKKKKQKPIVQTQEQRIGRDAARKYQYFFLEAVRQQDINNYAEAFELFRHCLEIDGQAPESHYAIARYYAVLGNDSIAKIHYERAVELEPQNGEFLESLGQFYLQQNEIDAAADLYERISAKYTDRTELLDVLLQIYQYKKDWPKVLKILERIETNEGASEQLTLSKMQVYSQMGDEEGAYSALDGLCKAHPSDLNYQVMMGNWALSHDRKAEAFDIFQRVIAEEPDHAQAQMSLMDYYNKEGNPELADTLLYKMLENPKTEPQTRISLMRQVIKGNEQQGGDSTRILGIFRHVLQYPQKTNDMALMQVAYMEYMKMPKDSIRTALEKVLEITPEETSARLKYIGLLWEDSIDDKVITECRKGIDYTPNEVALYYYLGLAQYIQSNDVKDTPRETELLNCALTDFLTGLNHKTSDTPAGLCANMYMITGDILHHLNLSDAAYEAYDSCLVYNPDEISCLNNYAYYLSEEGKDLKRAEKMSYRTIQAEPNNGTYLDTYAWILYMQGRYEEANIYIEQAIRAFGKEGASETILDHSKAIKKKLGK